MLSEATLDGLARDLLEADVLELRSVPAKVTNEEVEKLPLWQRPFLYASGNWGPGYLMVKGLVGNRTIIRTLSSYLAMEVADKWPGIEFVAGNVTGGMIPGWLVSETLELLLGRPVPFVYIRELRKTGGKKELITGIEDNPLIPPGAEGLDMEELVNFAQTIINGAMCLREAGYHCNKGACILYYDNPEANRQLAANSIEMVSLLTLPRVLDVAERMNPDGSELIREYRKFLADPLQWQHERGLKRVQKGETQ